MKNNNPFNIRASKANPWMGKDFSYTGAFEKFYFVEYGLRAGMKLLLNYWRRGLVTVRDIIRTYAPPTENDTEKYIDYVCSQLHVFSTTRLVFCKDFIPLCKAICWYESNYDVSYEKLEEIRIKYHINL